MPIRIPTETNLGETPGGDFPGTTGQPPESLEIPEIETPGLLGLTPGLVAGMTPAFNPSIYHVHDPLNPPEFPVVTVDQLNEGMSRYENAERGLQLHLKGQQVAGLAFDAIKERGRTLQKGFQAVTAEQQAKNEYINYLSVVEKVKQGVIQLGLDTYQTKHDAKMATLTQHQLHLKAEQGKVKLTESLWEFNQAIEELSLLRQSLGKYAINSK